MKALLCVFTSPDYWNGRKKPRYGAYRESAKSLLRYLGNFFDCVVGKLGMDVIDCVFHVCAVFNSNEGKFTLAKSRFENKLKCHKLGKYPAIKPGL